MAHWYTRSGESKYTLIGSNGVERDTTLRDAKKLLLLPSVTTIISQVYKRHLELWKMNQLLDAAHRCRAMEDMERFIKTSWDIYTEQTSVYSTKGTEIHNKLEQYFLTGQVPEEDAEWMLPAINEIMQLGYDLSEPELSFASPKGYGGKIDLVLRNGTTAIIDFKTKQGDKLGEKSVYTDYIMQLAAYRQAIDPKARCYNLFISTTHPGVVSLVEHPEEKLQVGLDMFNALLAFWQCSNNYVSSYDEA